MARPHGARARARCEQDRDPGGLVGGWAGGEKELKDWAAVPFSAIDPSLQNALKKFSTPAKEAPQVTAAPPPTRAPARRVLTSPAAQEGKDAIYVGKGKFVKGDARQYPVRADSSRQRTCYARASLRRAPPCAPLQDKELGGLTGGWAGGELGLKVDSSKFAAGTRVRVKGTLQPWMQNPLFARSNMALAGKEGVVSSARVDNGTLKVAVRVETGEAPVGQQADADVQWSRLVIFSDNELEVI
jgi:hypothetical protein